MYKTMKSFVYKYFVNSTWFHATLPVNDIDAFIFNCH